METSLPSTQFVALEGGDGSGKTTCRRLIFDALARKGRPPLALAGVSWAQVDSTELITKAKYFQTQFEASALLDAYVADRRRLSEHFIIPTLRERDVVTDRYLYSDIVYNSLHFGLSADATAAAFTAAELAQPDRLLFLDTPPEVAVERLLARGRPLHHWETLDQQKRAYEGFQRLLSDNPLGWPCAPEIIDNTRPHDMVAADVLHRLFGFACSQRNIHD
jgi:dTMP kinase